MRTQCWKSKRTIFVVARGVAVLAVALYFPLSARSGGTVNSCTESDLNAALAGGGMVTFACDGVITLSGTKTLSTDTVLDGSGHSVTISGGNSIQPFIINGGVNVTL